MMINTSFESLKQGPIILVEKECGSALRVFYLHSKYPHFNSTYLVRVPFSSGIAVTTRNMSGLRLNEIHRFRSKRKLLFLET